MNVVSRGIKNALRSPIRSGAIVLMLAISIGLVLSMLVARSSVDTKIKEVKANSGTTITISPAGIMGFSGGGTPLTSDQVATISKQSHISKTVSSLSDQMGTADTNLKSSIDFGSFGRRQERFEQNSSTASSSDSTSTPVTSDNSSSATDIAKATPTSRITVTGTTDPNSVSTDGGNLKISSGKTINGTSDELVALVGSNLATKNSLTVGSSFTAYGKTVTVAGIYKTGNTFQDGGIIMPLVTLQTLSSQTGSVTSVAAMVDSSDHVSSVVTALKTALGSKIDVTSQAEQAATSVSSLQSIANLALAGVIGATIAGAIIVLLAMVMIVRERRHEIGVVKAIGGSNFKVIAQFVVEALTLTIIGAVIGLALGVAVSGPMTSSLVSSQSSSTSETENSGTSGNRPTGSNMAPGAMMSRSVRQIGTNFTQVTSSLTPQTFIVAIIITLLIAVIGSSVPAWFIARIRPAEVLRTE
jgi:putative ABC transport system permease protein